MFWLEPDRFWLDEGLFIFTSVVDDVVVAVFWIPLLSWLFAIVEWPVMICVDEGAIGFWEILVEPAPTAGFLTEVTW